MAFNRAKTIKLAEKHVKAGKLLEAVAEYKKLADDNPRDMNVINKLGDLLARAGKNQEAIRYFLRIAEFYAKDGFFLKAIAMYKKISKIDPTNLDCLQRLAGLYVQQGLMMEAKAQYLQVADQMVKREQLQPAAEILPKVLEIDPDNLKVRKTLAEILVRTGKPEEAGRHYAVLARVLFETGRVDEALLVVRKGSRVTGAESEILTLLLRILRKGGQPAAALLAAAEEIAGVHKDKPLPTAVLGEACRRAGDASRAEKMFEHLSALLEMNDVRLPEVAEIIARHHASKNQLGESYEWVTRAVEGYLEASRVDEASAALDDFLSFSPRHPEALALRADLAARAGERTAEVDALQRLVPLLAGAGQSDRARDMVERLRSLDPDNATLDSLLRDLDAPGSATVEDGPAPDAEAESGDAISVDEPSGSQAEVADPDGFSTAKVPAIGMEVEEDVESIEGSDAMLTIEEEIEPEPDDAPSKALGPTAEVPPIGSKIQESTGGSSRIQELQADEGEAEPEDEEFISEHFTEAEVFIKYGLLEKAKQQLQSILERFPRHAASHAKLKEIYVGEGSRDKAVEECLALADIERARGQEETARALVNEAIRIDPGHARAAAYAAELGGLPSAAQEDAPDGTDRRSDRPIPPVVPELDLDLGEPDRPSDAEAAALRTSAESSGASLQDDRLPLPAGGDGNDMPLELDADEPLPPVRTAAKGLNPEAEKLGEVDFYIDQGLLEEARQAIQQLQKQYPGSNRELELRLQRIEAPRAAPGPQPETPAEEDGAAGLDLEVERALSGRRPEASLGAPAAQPAAANPQAAARPEAAERSRARRAATKPAAIFRLEQPKESEDGDFFDLASELDKSLEEAQTEADSRDKDALEGPGHSMEDIFQAFKKGVEQQVDSEDYETHYNLGIAYREMGLVDEAIGEFQFAARDPARLVECCGILGLCFRDKGLPDLALQWYRKALGMPELGEHESKGLRYDIAELYRERGDYQAALEAYTEVYGVDSKYRDVASKIQEMRGLIG